MINFDCSKIIYQLSVLFFMLLARFLEFGYVGQKMQPFANPICYICLVTWYFTVDAMNFLFRFDLIE